MANGLISTAISKTDPLTSIAGYDPALSEVQQNETVAGQLDALMKTDNPIMQGARTRAAQAANAKGLLNSSMATQAGEQAVIESALPIAQQDAATYANRALTNVAEKNKALGFTATGQSTGAIQQLQGQQAIEQQTLRGTQATGLANIEASFKSLMQANDSASRFFSQISAGISDILKEPTIPVDQKNQLVAKQTELLRSGLTIIGGISNLDLAGLLTFTATAAPVPAPAPTPAPAAATFSPEQIAQLKTALAPAQTTQRNAFGIPMLLGGIGR